MSMPVSLGSEPGESVGHTYSAVLVWVGERSGAREEVVAALRHIRLSGWVAPHERGWIPVVAAGAGTVAAGRRGVVGVGEALAEGMAATCLAIRVLNDRQLVLVAWDSGREVARYVSDPSREPRAEEDVLASPLGTEGAAGIATICGRPEAGDELTELLAEPLDPEQEIESERLGRVLRLLELPSWLVTAWRLPRAMSTGPAPRDLLRLGAGYRGTLGRVAGRAARSGRGWRRPPPVLLDPPRGDGGLDDPMMWL